MKPIGLLNDFLTRALLATAVVPALFAQSPLSASLQVDSSKVIRPIPATLFGSNVEWIWNENGLWNGTTNSVDSRYVPLVKSLAPPLLRFPGGLFADYYDWHNGVGPQASRPVKQSMPGGTLSTNTFGTDEAEALAKTAGGHLLITVNVGTGTAQMAADWVKYVNKTSAGPRADYWELGNELYMPASQVGSVGVATLTASQYAARFIEFATAMKAVDPSIKVGAILDESFTRAPASPWTVQVLSQAGSYVDFVTVHNAYAPVLWNGGTQDVRTVYHAMLAVPSMLLSDLNQLAASIDALVPARKGQIPIAVTEWGPFYSSDLSSPYLDHVKTLGSSLYTASALMAFINSPRTTVANFFKLNDALYMGSIGNNSAGAPQVTASYYALQLLMRTQGTNLVRSTLSAPGYTSPASGIVPSTSGVSYLDAIATQSSDRKLMRIVAVNKNFDSAINLQVNLGSLRPSGSAAVMTLSGTAIDANTGTQLPVVPGIAWAQPALATPVSRFAFGSPQEVRISTSTLSPTPVFTYSVPAASVVVIEIPTF